MVETKEKAIKFTEFFYLLICLFIYIIHFPFCPTPCS